MTPKLVVEAIGTFFLVFTVSMVVLVPGVGGFGPVAIGAVLMVMVYAGGHVSGAHYNPAVTLAVFLRGRATAAEVGGYWVAQLLAAVVASRVALWLAPEPENLSFNVQVGPAVVAEFLFTFALVFVILNVATSRSTKGNSYYGAAIGLTVTAGAFAVGGVSGAALNPAVAIDFIMIEMITPRSLWVLIVGELLGGIAAALVFNALDLGGDRKAAAAALAGEPPVHAEPVA